MTQPNNIKYKISFDEGVALIRDVAARRRLPVVECELDAQPSGCLGEDFVAPHDLPPFANSAMDGYAVCAADLPAAGRCELRLAATVLAGDTREASVQRGECVRITTGAAMPAGADTVVIQEHVHLDGGRVSVPGARAGQNVRPAGEDIRQGQIALQAGTRLGPAQRAVLAAFGQTRASLRRRPRLALFSTGDELVPAEQPLRHGQIHDSNGPMLESLARWCGAEVRLRAHLPDDPARMRTALEEAARRVDLIVTSGGASVGEADFLPQLLEAHGRVHFWKLRLKPGMPVLFGEFGPSLLLALPGNPVSTAAAFLTLVRPALDALQGAEARRWWLRARLAQAHEKRHDRVELVRATLSSDQEGVLWASPLDRQGSGMLGGLAQADVLALLPEAARTYRQGEVVRVLPLPGDWS